MNRLFKDFSGVTQYGQDPFLNFPIQLAENREHVMVRALAPGVRQKDLDIILAGQTLSITGRIPCRKGRYLRQECPCGAFRRDIELGCMVDGSAVKAELESGVLTIILRKHKSVRPRRIQVKYGG